MASVFALVDCNSFYASCEQVFDPTLVGKPVVILSNNDGCIISLSREAKRLGIRMGEPFHLIRPKLDQYGVRYISANFTLYGDMSRRVMEILYKFSPALEIYSIDEAFLELTDLQGDGKALDWTRFGREVHETVLQWTGLPISIGIARTKTLAKVGAALAKRSAKCSGVLNLVDAPYLDQALMRTPVGGVWGVGRQTVPKLEARRIRTAYDLSRADDRMVLDYFNVVLMRTVFELRGISCLPLNRVMPVRKYILSSRSFGRPVESLTELRQAVATYTARAAVKLRQEGLAAGAISVEIRTNRKRLDLPQYRNGATASLERPSDYTPELTRYACRALDRIYRPGYQYAKAAVSLGEIVPADGIQASLFDTVPRHRASRLMEVMDRINDAHGLNTLYYAGQNWASPWQGRRRFTSPCYTTSWEDLMEI